MSDFEIAADLWAEKFYEAQEKGEDLDPTMFDTDFIDSAVAGWEREDAAYLLGVGNWEKVELDDQ